MADNTSKKSTDKTKYLSSLLLILAFVLCFALGYVCSVFSFRKEQRSVDRLISLIQNNAIFAEVDGDGNQASFDMISDAIVSSVLKQDKYAKYYTEEEHNKNSDEKAGNGSGLGISFLSSDCAIYSVIGNSPAEIAGAKAGDKVIGIKTDETEFKQINYYSELSNYISAKPWGTTFTFKVLRGEIPIEYTITAKEYVTSYVKYFDSEVSYTIVTDAKKTAYKTAYNCEKLGLDSHTAMISLSQFNGQATEQFGYAMNLLKERGKTKLILDLRKNIGGNMKILREISGYLIDNSGKSKSVIAVSVGKNSEEKFRTKYNKYNSSITKTVVLADENTASASECLIGAMLYYGSSERDGNFSISDLVITKNQYGIAKTYGKGIMQTTYVLPNKGALKFTSAKIYLPDSKTSIHDVGFFADYNNAVTDKTSVSRAIEILSQG